MPELRIINQAVWRATPEAPKPDVAFVPALERRRLTPVERAALSVAHAACGMQNTDSPQIPVVFASRWGEIGTTVKLMTQFHSDHEMSPAGFSNSVHNAAPGAWSLFTHDRAPYTAIAARERSLEAGLLEALTTPGPVLFVYAEEETPELYRPVFPDIQSAHAVAVLFDRVETQRLGDIEVRVSVAFRSADLPPATFDAFTVFLAGSSVSFATRDFELRREGSVR